jgi:RHS repeat-associated protein
MPLNQRSTTSYNAVGNVNTVTDFNGKITTYKYDAQNRLVEEDFTNYPTVTMTYTIDGQVATITDGRGITSFSYDVRNRLISKTDVDGSKISYTYDLAGNRTSVTTQVLAGNANTTYYTFDERNRLDKVLSEGVVLTDYDYDAMSNLVKTTLSNGVVETRQYDKLDHLLNLQTNKGSNILTNFVYSLDKVGNRQQVVETVASNTRTVGYTYDDLYRLTKEQVTDGVNGNRTTQFVYDKVGNREQQKVTVNNVGTTTTYQYDANDRLFKEQINGNDKVIYTYDNNGNTLTKTEDGKTTESIWNDQNRLIGAKVKNTAGVVTQQVSYEYDASGIRVSQNVDGEITKYLIDANLPYAQAVAEYRPSGLVVVSYTHGNDLISQTRDGVNSFYHVDGLGSTRGLSDASGNLVDTYSYQAFGELLNSSGGNENKYLFAGEQFDPVLGDYYNRARYYDPESGRFTKRDDYEGQTSNPTSLHKYIYANGNPINFNDPSGLFTIGEAVAALAIIDTLTIHAILNTGIFFAGTQEPTDNVVVYVGYSSNPGYSYVGHTAIEVNGVIYDYPGKHKEPAAKFIADGFNDDYYLYHKYSINYNSNQVAKLTQNLETSLNSSYSDGSPASYKAIEFFSHDAFLYAHSCTTFVLDNLPIKPNNSWLFDLVIRRNISPFGLDADLNLFYSLSAGKTVKRLPDLYK